MTCPAEPPLIFMFSGDFFKNTNFHVIISDTDRVSVSFTFGRSNHVLSIGYGMKIVSFLRKYYAETKDKRYGKGKGRMSPESKRNFAIKMANDCINLLDTLLAKHPRDAYDYAKWFNHYKPCVPGEERDYSCDIQTVVCYFIEGCDPQIFKTFDPIVFKVCN